MWNMLMHFFADLILFTAGTAVLLFWIVVLVLLAIEIKDIITEHYFGSDEEEEN